MDRPERARKRCERLILVPLGSCPVPRRLEHRVVESTPGERAKEIAYDPLAGAEDLRTPEPGFEAKRAVDIGDARRIRSLPEEIDRMTAREPLKAIEERIEQESNFFERRWRECSLDDGESVAPKPVGLLARVA